MAKCHDVMKCRRERHNGVSVTPVVRAKCSAMHRTPTNTAFSRWPDDCNTRYPRSHLVLTSLRRPPQSPERGVVQPDKQEWAEGFFGKPSVIGLAGARLHQGAAAKWFVVALDLLWDLDHRIPGRHRHETSSRRVSHHDIRENSGIRGPRGTACRLHQRALRP